MKRTALRLAVLALAVAAIPVAAGFDPYLIAENAVHKLELDTQVQRYTELCNADLTHSTYALPANYTHTIVSTNIRTAVQNMCVLAYSGKRLLAGSVGYALLNLPEAKREPRLDDAVEAILELEPVAPSAVPSRLQAVARK